MTNKELNLTFELLDRIWQDGVVQRLYSARLNPAEELRLIVACEPVEEGLLLHVSASVGRLGVSGATRRPTDGEMSEVRKQFSTYRFEEEPPKNNPFVRHLWEKANV